MERRTALFVLMLSAAGCGGPSSLGPEQDASVRDGGVATGEDAGTPSDAQAAPDAPSTVGKIEHVVLIMQENRSFDHYFGMYPGADGFTLDATGAPTNCNPDPHLDAGCVKSFHDPTDANSGGPHSAAAFKTCFDDGKMDGFIKNAEGAKTDCADPQDPTCSNGKLVDVMGYKTAADIPNYWSYARALHPPRPPVRERRVVELADAPVHGVRVGGALHLRGPDELREQHRAERAGRDRLLLVDSAHVHPRREEGQLALLPRAGHDARLRQRRAGVPARDAARERPEHLEPAPVLRGRQGRGRAELERRDGRSFLRGREGGHAASGLVDRAGRRGQRAPAEPGERGSGVRDVPRQRDRPGPGALDQHGRLRLLGRLGRVLRSRPAHQGRRERIRVSHAGHRHQRLGQAGVHRSPAAQLRRLCQVHRGHVPLGPAPRPGQRRSLGFPTRRARVAARPRAISAWTSTSRRHPTSRSS